MAEILLSTLNAKYIHASFGLRYLLANLGEFAERATLHEFDINQRSLEIAESLLAQNPTLIGFGVYIWNTTETQRVIEIIKRVRPEIIIVLGGPEVSYETESQPIVHLADYVICGEADIAFRVLVENLFAVPAIYPATKIIKAPLPQPQELKLPYAYYHAEDLAHRIVYIEASRGCPFTCEFCLSSLEIPVRQFELSALLPALEDLLRRGLKQFKFVDRTFNLNLKISKTILEFFLQRYTPGMFVHFEMIPDRLPPALREVIARFPPGVLQFEVGIQSFNPEVCKLISRRQDFVKVAETLQFLRTNTGVHIHADLIAGLPGEDMESFGRGFDQLIALGPQEIQVGILKRLRGTPLVRHDQAWKMVYSNQPPYEILQNALLSFSDLQRLRRFARYWDLIANSGNFIATTPLLWQAGQSPFHSFLQLSDWLFVKLGKRHGIALHTLAEALFEYLCATLGLPEAQVREAQQLDFKGVSHKNLPNFLKPQHNTPQQAKKPLVELPRLPKRQQKRVAGL